MVATCDEFLITINEYPLTVITLGKTRLKDNPSLLDKICPGSILLAKICYQISFAIVAKEIIEKKLCPKITYKYRKNRKNNKSNKNQDLVKKEAKKDPEMSANIAKITNITRIFFAS